NARLEHIGEFAHLFARALESLLLRDIIDSQDLGKVSHILHRGRDLLDVGAVAEESSHLDALLNLLQRSPNVDGDETKKSEGEERECNRHHAQRTQQWRAAGSRQCFTGGPHLDFLYRAARGVVRGERLVERACRRRRFGGVENYATVV